MVCGKEGIHAGLFVIELGENNSIDVWYEDVGLSAKMKD